MDTKNTAARRPSVRSRIASVLAAATFASILGFGATAAAPAPTMAAAPRWFDAETFELKLINCTRTGGWVRTDGTCKGYGSGTYSKYVAPLKRTAGLSAVSRRWAKHIAATNQCAHGDPGARLKAAGYHASAWGENIGCGSYYTARRVVLLSHLAFQNEKSTNGGHWRNIKNPAYKYVGIGVWKSSGRSRLVLDFYRP
jgi:hypothetical protein